MNLVFIHGRGQGGKDPAELLDRWRSGLDAGFDAAGLARAEIDSVELPFYGKVLDDLVDRLGSTAIEVIDKGADPAAAGDVDPLTAEFVRQMAKRAGIDEEEVAAELTVAERGPERWEWVQRLAQRIEAKAPWLGELAIGRFTADVNAYLKNAYVQSEVNKLVLPALQRGPCVVVSHSLGSIVAYVTLATNPQLEVPLLVTAGSPLGIGSIKASLPFPLRVPADAWLNITDDADFVALYASLDAATFIDGIDNIIDIDNGDEPHSIVRYLSDERVARRLATALGA